MKRIGLKYDTFHECNFCAAAVTWRYTNLKPLPAEERTRSKEKHLSWVQLHKQFLERNKDLWGDRQPATDDLYAIDPSDIPKEW